jgi:hypothetical protein
MMREAELLGPAAEDAYAALIEKQTDSLLYTSPAYLRLLERCVSGERLCLGVRQGDRLLGALPCFLKRAPAGNVLNSLPFYGSHGGGIVSGEAQDPEGVLVSLLEGFKELAKERNAVSYTVITSPFEERLELYERVLAPRFRDRRIGQITALPVGSDDPETALMALLHGKTRNMVRKARRLGVRFLHSDEDRCFEFLEQAHRENLKALSGPPKPGSFFQAVRQEFRYDRDYRLYLAEFDERPVSALLVFFNNRTAEYYMPATLASHRSLQPNSLLVFEAMKHATSREFCYWNFGGTWPSQHGVYQFKNRWGARDRPYDYLVGIHGDMERIRSMEPSELTEMYPSFYVVPFADYRESAAPAAPEGAVR